MWTSIEYDENKSRKNEIERGLPFSMVTDFDFDTANVHRDLRKDYGEERFEAMGFIGTRLHILVFCVRQNAIRVISLRKANNREVRAYYEDQNTRRTIS
ncbi:BrnT family toxin [Actinobacillus porcinus]|uniref:BrnT family toxin n=1 Tax=Actinobacillus porcinus TaxID=51048 RepID=UPI002A90FD89|nr:BrnT family toxin [Actinobacillus porcinus]MDY6215141.1 BrnT family toxin [Actinobacillus porcinus]